MGTGPAGYTKPGVDILIFRRYGYSALVLVPSLAVGYAWVHC